MILVILSHSVVKLKRLVRLLIADRYIDPAAGNRDPRELHVHVDVGCSKRSWMPTLKTALLRLHVYR